jgi:predicted  nucleic acid-binding Zn-ribbon protein
VNKERSDLLLKLQTLMDETNRIQDLAKMQSNEMELLKREKEQLRLQLESQTIELNTVIRTQMVST